MPRVDDTLHHSQPGAPWHPTPRPWLLGHHGPNPPAIPLLLQVEDDPTGGKYAAQTGILGGAPNKLTTINNFHVRVALHGGRGWMLTEGDAVPCCLSSHHSAPLLAGRRGAPCAQPAAPSANSWPCAEPAPPPCPLRAGGGDGDGAAASGAAAGRARAHRVRHHQRLYWCARRGPWGGTAPELLSSWVCCPSLC